MYANLLGEKIARHHVEVWLSTTGWSGGPYGTGKRMNLMHTRAMVTAALDGSLARVPMTADPVFGVQVPQTCPQGPSEVVQPRATWKDPQVYDIQARKLDGWRLRTPVEAGENLLHFPHALFGSSSLGRKTREPLETRS